MPQKMLSKEIIRDIAPHHLLNHPFYQLWNQGKLPEAALIEYIKAYYFFVLYFPQLLSAAHSRAESWEARKLLLENLVEEEKSGEDHPSLWRDFGKLAFGVSDYRQEDQSQALVELENSLRQLSSSACLIGAVFAHEAQYFEVAKFKYEALKSHYNLQDENALKFFSLHADADVWHSQQIADLINAFKSEREREEAKLGAKIMALGLWKFLDEMMNLLQSKHGIAIGCHQ